LARIVSRPLIEYGRLDDLAWSFHVVTAPPVSHRDIKGVSFLHQFSADPGTPLIVNPIVHLFALTRVRTELWFGCTCALGRGAGCRRGGDSWKLEGTSPRYFFP
jgi:hypothetical protein